MLERLKALIHRSSSIPMDTWLKQSGLVKKLELALALSILCNICLILSLIPKAPQQKQIMENPNKQSQKKSDATTSSDTGEINKHRTLSETELKSFIRKYLENFFNSSEAAFHYIKEQSQAELFENEIRAELVSRMEQKIQSTVSIDNIFLESVDKQYAKAVCFLQENFNNKYQSRRITIELLVDTHAMKISSIPVFKVSNK